jgi:hypothetical protein
MASGMGYESGLSPHRRLITRPIIDDADGVTY